jgi:hypothetical protein
MIRTLLASSAAAALLAASAAAGTPGMPAAQDTSTWQLAQAQPLPDTQAPAAGDPAAPPADPPAADAPAATDQPPEVTAQEPAPDAAPGDVAEEPATDVEPGDVAEAAPEQMDTAVFITEQAETHWLATDYIGDTVYNRQDEAIGSINDLIVEEEGGLVGFVVGVGGFLGIGQKRVAIDLDAVEFQQDEDGNPKLVIAGSREALMDAPDFTDKAAQRAERERQQREAEMQSPPGGAPGAPGGMPGQQ